MGVHDTSGTDVADRLGPLPVRPPRGRDPGVPGRRRRPGSTPGPASSPRRSTRSTWASSTRGWCRSASPPRSRSRSPTSLACTPATRVENACASGSAALQQGVKSLLAGTARTVLVIGAEKMTHAPAEVGAALLGADYEPGRNPRAPASPASSRRSRSIEKRHGPVSDALGLIAAKNHRNGVHNPFAQLRRDLGVEFCQTVSEKNPMVAEPAAAHGLLARLGRRRGRGALDDAGYRGGHEPRPTGRVRARQRLPSVRRDPLEFGSVGRLAAGDDDGGRGTRRPRPRRGPRLLHHRRARSTR